MDKPISPRLHGALDYTTVAAIAAAPGALGFPEGAPRICYVLASGYLGLAAFTDYPLGAVRTIPFRAHGAADSVLGIALPALPWLLGFAHHRRPRNFFLGLAAVTVVVTSLTDWNCSAEERSFRSRHKSKVQGPGATTREGHPEEMPP